MKSVAVLLALVGGFALAAAEARGSRLQHFSVAGRDHVRLADWARQNGLDARWLVRNQTAAFSNPSTRFTVKVDSQKAVLNNVNVTLNWPVVLRDGLLYIASQDITTVVAPVLYPPRNISGAKVRTICLDPGHGGKDPGNLDGRQQEKKYTLLLALELADQLRKQGFKVALTRTGDRYLDLPSRPDEAVRVKADLLISLHFNSFRSPEIKGIEVYCITPRGASSTQARGEGMSSSAFPGNIRDDKNMLLAYQLQKALTRELRAEDRGVQHARWAVLRDARMPAVLIEGGFMSNPSEARKIYDANYRRQMAQSIADGVAAYKQLTER